MRLGWPIKPAAYSWRQLVGAGALAGIGFTMSLFIAARLSGSVRDFAAAKIAVFAASVISAIAGVAILWNAQRPQEAASRAAARATACDAEEPRHGRRQLIVTAAFAVSVVRRSTAAFTGCRTNVFVGLPEFHTQASR